MNPNKNRVDLFSGSDAKNPTDFNNFDLSHRVRFTAKAGELLPVSHRTLMAGDKIRLKLSSFTRTTPTVNSPYTNIREFVDAFFVPYRQLWRNAPQSFTFNTQNPISATSYNSDYQGSTNPFTWDYREYISTFRGNNQRILYYLNQRTNSLGFNRGKASVKLLNYLEYPYISESLYNQAVGDSSFGTGSYVPQQLSIAPLLAYQKIYNDYFRNSQWENSRPSCFNIDYSDGSYSVPVQGTDPNFYNNATPFDLRYSCFPKDSFFGIVPNTQHGNVSTVPESFSIPPSQNVGIPIRSFNNQVGAEPSNTDSGYLWSLQRNLGYLRGSAAATTGSNNTVRGYDGSNSQNVDGKYFGVLESDIADRLQGSFNILDLRFAQADQRFKEILGTGKLDYANIVSKIFGYSPSVGFTDTVIYLGGTPQDIQFNETANTNLTSDAQPTISANGVSRSFDGDYIDFTAPDFGILMIIYHVQPDIEFTSKGIHPDILKVHVDDYANPVFDRIGMTEMPLPAWYAPLNKFGSPSNLNLGYTFRYWDYKTSRDLVKGDFLETKSSWVAPIDSNYIEEFLNDSGTAVVTPSFFMVDPSLLDQIFYVKCNDSVSTDQFLPSVNIELYSSRNLNRYGLPNT